MTKTTSTKCDSNFPQCKRNAVITFEATAFTSELKLCRKHAEAFRSESVAFYSRNA